MKLLDRYLLREMVVPFLIGQGAIVMMLTGSVLYNNADVLLINQVPVGFVVRIALYFIPFLVHMTMPVAMAVAASLAVSRLGRDSEITVIRAAGVSLVRLFAPIYLLGLVVSVGDFLFGEYVVPPALARFQSVMDEIPSHIPHLNPQAGQWIISGNQEYALYVQNMRPQRGYVDLRGVTIMQGPKTVYEQGAQPRVMYADKGQYRDGQWTLQRPYMFQFAPDGSKRTEAWPEKNATFAISVDPQSFSQGLLLQLPMWKMNSAVGTNFLQMRQSLARERKQGVTDYPLLLNYHFKMSIPFSCLVMALCCPPLSLRFARGGGFMGTLLSICLVFVYWNTLLLARLLGSPTPSGGPPLVPPPIAAWSQNVIFVLLGIWILRRSEKG